MSQKIKSASGDVAIVTVDPRRPATSEISKRLQELEIKIRSNYKGVIVDSANRPGFQLCTKTSYQILSNELEFIFAELAKQLSGCQEGIIFLPISNEQLLREPPPDNCYKKGNFMNQSLLQYRIYKTEARLVRSILEAANFTYTDSHLWNILWVNGVAKDYLFEGLNEFQRINHFPNSTQLTHKDKMVRNIINMQERFGKENFYIIPDSFLLPDQFTEFYSQFNKEKCVWIVKPNTGARGNGIYLVDTFQEVPVDELCVISKYVANPLLINGLKFDIRIYVVVTSYEPLKIYVYKEGLARFASESYIDEANKTNRYAHLTNYSVNKKNERFIQNQDIQHDDQGHK